MGVLMKQKIVFRKEVAFARFLEPQNNFEEKEVKVKIRRDPLTNWISGIVEHRANLPGSIDLLATSDALENLWGYGFVKVNVAGSLHPANYACKYITKMKGKDFMMAMMWWFKVRTYTFSRSFKYKGEDWVNPGWEFLKRGRRKDRRGLESLDDTVSRLREDEGYVVINGELLKLWSRRFEWGGG